MTLIKQTKEYFGLSQYYSYNPLYLSFIQFSGYLPKFRVGFLSGIRCIIANLFAAEPAVRFGRNISVENPRSSYEPSLENDLKNAPLAQLVEHLTLNQGVPGSSP